MIENIQIFYFEIGNQIGQPELTDQLYNTAMGPILITTTSVALLSSLCSFWYIFSKLKLNPFIKAIYYVMSCQNVIGQIVILTSESYILYYKYQSMTQCAGLIFTGIFLISSNIPITSIMSVIKFYMTWKASQTKIAKSKIIFLIIMTGIVLTNVMVIFLFYKAHSMFQKTPVAICANQESIYSEIPYILPLNLLRIIIHMIVGFLADFGLYYLIKNR